MTSPLRPQSAERPALQKFRTALNALYFEVEPSIANDIVALANAAITEAEAYARAAAPKNAEPEWDESESPATPRDLAVTIVDLCCGYTLEFAGSRNRHEYLYDRVASFIQGILNRSAAPAAPLRNFMIFKCVLVTWGIRCFGLEHMANAEIRGLRLLEEAIEFAQSVGVQWVKCRDLINYVYDRPPGNPHQELGGVGVTWLAAAHALEVSANDILLAEIKRVESKTPEHFTERNQAKIDAGFDVESAPLRPEGK